MGIVPQRTEAIRENHRNIEMKAYGVLTSLILLFSLASAADIQQQLAKENAKLESIRHYINNMKIPLERLGIDLENLQVMEMPTLLSTESCLWLAQQLLPED